MIFRPNPASHCLILRSSRLTAAGISLLRSLVNTDPSAFDPRKFSICHTVNPAALSPLDAVIPWSRIQSPPKANHLFYACIYDWDRTAPQQGVICFFAIPIM